jgi:hypothetical protein
MAIRPPATTALLVALMFAKAKKNRARISSKTLILLAKHPGEPDSGYIESVKRELLNSYSITFFERPKGGYIGLKLNDLDTSASLKAADTLGNIHKRAMTPEHTRILRNLVFRLSSGDEIVQTDTQDPLLLPCFQGDLYYDSEDFDSDLISVQRLIVRERNGEDEGSVAFDMTTTWNDITDKLILSGKACWDKASGKYVSEYFDVRSLQDKEFLDTATINLELNPGSEWIDVKGILKIFGEYFPFSGELARSVPDKKTPTPFPIKRADAE